MTRAGNPTSAGARRTTAALLGLVLLFGLFAIVNTAVGAGGDTRTVTATFTQAVNVHEGDEVRILGVPVGTVVSVDPAADGVTVEMTYDADYPLSSEATAAIVTPTLVSVRYIQLGPLAEDGEPTLADDAELPVEATAAPLEWDAIKSEVDELVTVLGPRAGEGGTTEGSLRRLLQVTAANLDGQGASFRGALQGLAGAFETLNRGGDDLFAVVRNLATFVDALAANDAQVAEFNTRLAEVSGILSANRDDLGALLRTLDRNAAFLTDFVRSNRRQLATSVKDLGDLTSSLAKSRQALADVLQRAPVAVSNLHNIYDPFSGSVTTSAAVTNFNDPAQFLCGIAMGAAPEGPTSTDARRYCETALDPLLDLAQLGNAPVGINGNERDPDDASPATPAAPGAGAETKGAGR